MGSLSCLFASLPGLLEFVLRSSQMRRCSHIVTSNCSASWLAQRGRCTAVFTAAYGLACLAVLGRSFLRAAGLLYGSPAFLKPSSFVYAVLVGSRGIALFLARVV